MFKIGLTILSKTRQQIAGKLPRNDALCRLALHHQQQHQHNYCNTSSLSSTIARVSPVSAFPLPRLASSSVGGPVDCSARCFSTSATKRSPVIDTTTHKDDYQVDVTSEKKQLILRHGDNTYRFHAVWLRHNCQCAACRQEASGQKTIDVHLLSPSYTISHASIEDDLLHVHVEEENEHEIVVAVKDLLDSNYSTDAREQHRKDMVPKVIRDGSMPEISFDEILSSDQGLLRWLQQVNDYGISLVHNVPTEDGMVKTLAEKVWDVQKTIYGEIFDVVSTPSPINIAYSTSKLGYHQDLVYYESPPGLQLLHCLKFDECVVGGESEFVDAWAVAEEMRVSHPHHFLTLATVPATFQKIHYDRELPVHMRFQRPHIQLAATHENIMSEEDIMAGKGDIVAVVWAPSFEGPLCVDADKVESYYEAYNVFAKLLEASDTTLEVKLQPGDCVIFNNRRLLHARKVFELNGGGRHLQGCYVNIDEFKCRLQVLQTLLGDTQPAKKVFNQSTL